jgi:hypothetical protein
MSIDGDPVFVTHGTVKESNGKPLNPQHVIEIVKNAAHQVNIPRESIWTHCLRKAFRKTLYGRGVDPDVAEALMGHKLGASKTSYFDYHDLCFVKKEYSKGNLTRISIAKIEDMKEEITELRKTKDENVRLQQKVREIEQFLSTFEKSTRTEREFEEDKKREPVSARSNLFKGNSSFFKLTLNQIKRAPLF